MKNKLLSIMLVFVAVSTTMLNAAKVEYGDRPFYGFFLSNEKFTNASKGAYGFARQTFNSLGENELIHQLTENVGIYAATAVDGIYYAIPYQFVSSMQEPSPLPMFTYNLYTGHIEEIGEWNTEGSSFKPSDMTYDMKNDRILALGFDPVNMSAIYEVDRNSGKFTKLVTLPSTGGVIASDAFGRVFTITVDGYLCQVDMSRDKQMTELLSLSYSGLSSNQSLEFDITSNKLYWAANCTNNPSGDNGRATRMVEITMPTIGPDQNYSKSDTYTVQEIGEIGHTSRFQGMYIPYATGGFLAPGFSTDIKTESAADGKSCHIEFKAPTTTFGGEPLTSIDGFDIYRNGEKIHTQKDLAPGAPATFDDQAVPASGEYRYDIVCYSNINGDGPRTPAFAYVGFDRPAAVSNVAVEVGDDFRTVSITWDAPTEGAFGGSFDPKSTTYDITRLPDNVVVAQGLTNTSYTDNVNRLLRYSYRIESKNEYGTSRAVSKEFVAGTPVSEFPVEENFENKDAMLLKWTPVDNNEDGMTWLFGTTLGQSVFGDYETTAEYIISPTSVDSNVKDADEWLISPPIAFGDETYAVELQIRSLTPEHLNIYAGNKNTVEAMEIVNGFDVRQPQYNDQGQMLLQKYTIQLPESLRNTVGCVGIQLATPLSKDLYSYLQLGSITIDKASALPVNQIQASDLSISCDRKTLVINGDYTNGAIYSVGGIKIKEISGHITDIQDLSTGVYLLIIDEHNFKIVK